MTDLGLNLIIKNPARFEQDFLLLLSILELITKDFLEG